MWNIIYPYERRKVTYAATWKNLDDTCSVKLASHKITNAV